jgi:hypothetical protein
VFTTKCPQCGKILWFSDKIAGTLTICPACGAKMRLEAAPTDYSPHPPRQLPSYPPSDPSEPPPEAPLSTAEAYPIEELPQPAPPEADQSSLTYRAASAVGEVHVDVEETDLVLWTMQPHLPAQYAPPPAWQPPSLGAPDAFPPGRIPPPPPPRNFGPDASTPDSRRGPAGIFAAIPAVVWLVLAGVVLAIGLALGLILITKPVEKKTWEEAHRQEILDIKQQAEDFALAGKNREAYEKYQELEKLVTGQAIDDPYLVQELDRSWKRRDLIYDLAISGPPAAPPLPPPAPTPQPAPLPPIDQSPPAATQPIQSAPPPSPPHDRLSSAIPPAPKVPVQPPSPPVPPPAVAVSSPPVLPPRPKVHAITVPAKGITDARIGDAITRGVNYLLNQFDGPEIPKDQDYHDGLDSLVVYALMQCGLATHDRRLDVHGQFMNDAIDAMNRLTMTPGEYPPHSGSTEPTTQPPVVTTYGHALRATALALYDRPQDHFVIRNDVEWLLHAQLHGAFTYSNQFAKDTSYPFWDNSNSQYGLLGIWSGAEVGIRVPPSFWQDAQDHWTKDQFADGQWHYTADDPAPRRSMTLAGIASLFVSQDYLDAQARNRPVGQPPLSPALVKSLTWLEHGDNSVIDSQSFDEQDWTYTLYGMERVGLASGLKYFGSHDWYREEATRAIDAQKSDGSWTSPSGNLVGTSYSLLFLARGRHPIIMNKLRFDGAWANRPRDAANLARFAARELERPLNWQVVSLNRDWHEWNDSRILYLASHTAPKLTDPDRDKLRQYVQNGGMLLLQNDGEGQAFDIFAEDLGKNLFPQYDWIDLPADHPLNSVSYRLAAPPVPIKILTNGSRILMMRWPQDVSIHWQLRQERDQRWAFELGVNLVLYSAGKSELRNRLDSEDIPPPALPAAPQSLCVARLRYDGNWDPEPQAWPTAAREFRRQTGLGLTIQPTPAEDLVSANPPLAHLTGTARWKPTNAQIDSIKKYVEGGGVLLIDPCGGRTDQEFLQSVEQDLLARAFPDSELAAVDPNHPLLTVSADGMANVASPAVRDYVRSLVDAPDHHPQMFKAGKGHVIVLPLDLTSGLLGADAWGIAGYTPAYARTLLKNIVLWTWDGSKDR